MVKYYPQKTLAGTVSCSGVGVHSGKEATLTIKPGDVNYGIRFFRIDLPGTPAIQALFNNVVDTSLATVIGSDGVIISTIEHLMATFTGLGIDNAIVELNSYEMPIMDGSAAEFSAAITKVGILEQNQPKCFIVVNKPIKLGDSNKFVEIIPSSIFKITCSIEFKHRLIGKQSYNIEVIDKVFNKEISGARTFGFFHEVEYLKRFGLAKGGSLENAVVIDNDKILNENGLRFPDEFVRHKLLDCIGDFSLLGMPLLGHIYAHKSGHAFNHAFLKEIFLQKECWETKPMPIT
ncbi:MAG: UDP-3-O-[3-hydroxymyristoyl] N-acetylglucosamine deacetylase [Desulfobacteraceae bacterium 4572_19]|nr:MAG: UDP-3-O-[3-hydroxymyristoyl] N-acetylglucosamine deacetylase [Desulfobacteraceae bacterium 4572_19]